MLGGIRTRKKLVVSSIGLPFVPKPGRGGRDGAPGFAASLTPAQTAQATNIQISTVCIVQKNVCICNVICTDVALVCIHVSIHVLSYYMH